jgi:hypothetical protein
MSIGCGSYAGLDGMLPVEFAGTAGFSGLSLRPFGGISAVTPCCARAVAIDTWFFGRLDGKDPCCLGFWGACVAGEDTPDNDGRSSIRSKRKSLRFLRWFLGAMKVGFGTVVIA